MWTKRSEIQLAYPFEEKRLAKWKPPYIVQPKLDGERCRAVVDSNGRVVLYSSEVNEIVSVPHINQQLEDMRLKNVEFDGELYVHGWSFNDISSVVGRTVNISPVFEEMEYHIFDIVDLTKEQIARTTQLEELDLWNENIRTVPSMIADNLSDIMRKLDIMEASGYEGIIVRHIMAPYVRRRSIYMMKWKPKRKDDYKIVEVLEAIDQYGKPKGMIGAFQCTSDGTEVFKAGAGHLTHDERRELWDIKEVLIGETITVEYQHLTSGRGVPRHGRAYKLKLNGGEKIASSLQW